VTARRHIALRGLGAKTLPESGGSPRARSVSQAALEVVKNLKTTDPFLQGARFDAAAYAAARVKAEALVEQAAQSAGQTTLTAGEIQQLLLGGLNLLARGANMLGIIGNLDGPQWRDAEDRLVEAVQGLAQGLGAFHQSVAQAIREAQGVNGLGSILLIGPGIPLVATIVLGAAAVSYYLGRQDAMVQVMREVCMTYPDSPACTRLIEQTGLNPGDMAKPVTDAVGKLVWWVGGGVAVLALGYLLFTFGPAAASASRSVRRRSLRGGPKRVHDLDGPSTYDLEV
jgi:hypothetical protein